MSASADVLALAKVEVELDAIPEGKNVRIILCACLNRQRAIKLTVYRSSSNGVASLSSSATGRRPRLTRPTASPLPH